MELRRGFQSASHETRAAQQNDADGRRFAQEEVMQGAQSENKFEINHLIDELNEYGLPKVFDYRYFQRRFFQQKDYIKKSKKIPKTCIFPGCHRKSIVNSHSLQKEGPLRLVSKDGNVIHPQMQNSTTNVEFEIIGINKASVFSGFCEDHEKIFDVYEKGSQYTSESIVLLQNFRALCREMVNRKIIAEAFSKQKQYYYNDQIEANNKLLQKHSESLKLLRYNDFIIDGFDRLITDNSVIISLLEEFYSEYIKILVGNGGGLSNYYIDSDLVIPISLSGLSVVEFGYKERTIKFIVICSVIPNSKGTQVMLTTLNKWKALLDYYVQRRIWHNLSILSLVESWMMYGSDNWYMNPDTYENIPVLVRERMKRDFTNLSMTPYEEVGYSIFRDIRTGLINATKEHSETLSDADEIKEYNQLLMHETAKQVASSEEA